MAGGRRRLVMVGQCDGRIGEWGVLGDMCRREVTC